MLKLKKHLLLIVDFITDTWATISGPVLTIIGDIWLKLIESFTTVKDFIVDTWDDVWDFTSDTITKAWDSISTFMTDLKESYSFWVERRLGIY